MRHMMIRTWPKKDDAEIHEIIEKENLNALLDENLFHSRRMKRK